MIKKFPDTIGVVGGGHIIVLPRFYVAQYTLYDTLIISYIL